MLTAAVRDLHVCYPRRFVTDIRTSCPGLWENNPYLGQLDENAVGVTSIECHYRVDPVVGNHGIKGKAAKGFGVVKYPLSRRCFGMTRQGVIEISNSA